MAGIKEVTKFLEDKNLLDTYTEVSGYTPEGAVTHCVEHLWSTSSILEHSK